MVAEIEKTILPKQASPDTVELLIKAKHFFAHAKIHTEIGDSFDTMIAIHSLDNSIEYLLKILIKHLEIEEKLQKTINTPELMALFAEVDKFLKEHCLLNGRGIGLPYENEIRQLRGLRNNVQHGLILPVGELQGLLNYCDKFFDKILAKVFGLTMQEIAYSSLIENECIKGHLRVAEYEISIGNFLKAIVACRDAFELGQFLLADGPDSFNKTIATPYIKRESEELYYYMQEIDEKISVLGGNINFAEYKLYSQYVKCIPNEYNAIDSIYPQVAPDWGKQDADFCYSFVAHSILNWQFTQIKRPSWMELRKPHYYKTEQFINDVLLPDLYLEKTCVYMLDNSLMGEIIYVAQDIKNMLRGIREKAICCVNIKKYEDDKSPAIEHKKFGVIKSNDFRLVLNNGPLWEMHLRYRVIPFATLFGIKNPINIDFIQDFQAENDEQQRLIDIVLGYGDVDTAERAFDLEMKLKIAENNSAFRRRLVSEKLIECLENQCANLVGGGTTATN